jgi:hypothetical protein
MGSNRVGAASFKAVEEAGRRFYAMYSTCLFCHTTLGANEAVEHFPVGRRLAFDAAKGRLWVVCRKCERWNLTPVEERWEAIEECERSFRDTKLRVSTDQIGMSRLGEGLELVRIGKPLRPEFAAWRYGDQFGRRRRRNILKVGATAVAAASVMWLGPAVGLSFAGGGYYLFHVGNFGFGMYKRTRIVARVRDNDGNLLLVRTHEVKETVILPPSPDRPWGLRIKHRAPEYSATPWWRYTKDADETDVRGEDALQVAAQLLPKVNEKGASREQVKDAVAIATEHVDPLVIFDRAARLADTKPSWKEYGKGAKLASIPAEMRLALEMTSHEESEKRAMEGELYLLEDAWREAEEIAAISDDMFLPTGVTDTLAEIKDRVKRQKPQHSIK